MSTRCTLAIGESFHLYRELLEDSGSVYLTIEHCSACHGEQTIRIPGDVWEAIRKVRTSSFDLVDVSDEQIQERAEAHVDKALTEPPQLQWLRLPGPEGAPREEHVRLTVEELLADRERQRGILDRAKGHTVYKQFCDGSVNLDISPEIITQDTPPWPLCAENKKKESTMEILHRGTPPGERLCQGTCAYCGTIVRFVANEGVPYSDQREGDWWTVKCPVCPDRTINGYLVVPPARER